MAVVTPRSNQGPTGPLVEVYSPVPCPHSITNLVQDNTAGTLLMGNSIWSPQGEDYDFHVSWTPLAGPVSGLIDVRLSSSGDRYYVTFAPANVYVTARKAGQTFLLGGASRTISTAQPALLTVSLIGYRIVVKDDAVSGSPTLIDVTDPNQTTLSGTHVRYYTGVGTKAIYDFARGQPR